METRSARCQCGRLTAIAVGEPQIIGVCHCEECQRRTGSAFGLGAYYPKEQVRLEGPKTVFTRWGHSGGQLHFSFCPTCGTTLYWELDAFPDLCGLAVGTIDGPRFQQPSHSWWERSAHAWVRVSEPVQRSQTQ
jgi:hypothetical protein